MYETEMEPFFGNWREGHLTKSLNTKHIIVETAYGLSAMASATFTSWQRRPPHRFVVDYYTFGDSKSNIVQFVADVACADSAASTVDCRCFAGSVSDTLRRRTLTNYGKEVNNVCVIPM